MMKTDEFILVDNKKIKFTSVATLCIDKKIEDFVSIASIDNLKSLIPAGLSINDNLVPFVGNLWVANLSNGNGDTLNTETSLAYYKLFEHTKIDLEHNFEMVLGHIVSAHLTSFDEGYKQGAGSEILEEKDVKGTDKLFNVAIVGVLYKESAPAVIDKIIESNDKGSDNYLKCSLSWETKFEDYNILLGHSVGNGKIVTDEKKILELTPYLRGNKGSGKLMDGTPVNRLIVGEISPMGAGITLSPAAKVSGILVSDEMIEEHKQMKTEEQDLADAELKNVYIIEKDGEDIIAVANQNCIANQLKDLEIKNNESGISDKMKKSENNISHLENASVILNDNKSINQKTYIKMKFIESLASLEKVTDEDLQKGEVSVANVLQVVKDGIKQANDKYVTELNAEKTAVAAAQKESEDAKKAALEAKVSADKAQEKIAALETVLANQEAGQKFQLRMGGLDDKYELDDEYRAVVASDLEGLSDEDFDKYAKKFAVIAKHLNKETLAAASKKEAKVEKKDVKEVVKAALENAELEKETVPNASAVGDDIKAKLKEAFSTKNLIK